MSNDGYDSYGFDRHGLPFTRTRTQMPSVKPPKDYKETKAKSEVKKVLSEAEYNHYQELKRFKEENIETWYEWLELNNG